MHFEFLVEDISGVRALKIIVPKLLKEDTYNFHHYKGVGRIPKGLRPKSEANRRILLDQLPRLLQGFGRVPAYGNRFIIVICDLDKKDKKNFLAELNGVLNVCDPKPDACFCLAIEEFEAWYLGDLPAVREAYPRAKNNVLSNYVNDSICDTWEVLADAVYKGGRSALLSKGWHIIGTQKSVWAETISPHMNVETNASPSFQYFRGKLQSIATATV